MVAVAAAAAIYVVGFWIGLGLGVGHYTAKNDRYSGVQFAEYPLRRYDDVKIIDLRVCCC
jgi:hypothetical protein